jgi:hypothetical protein
VTQHQRHNIKDVRPTGLEIEALTYPTRSRPAGGGANFDDSEDGTKIQKFCLICLAQLEEMLRLMRTKSEVSSVLGNLTRAPVGSFQPILLNRERESGRCLVI